MGLRGGKEFRTVRTLVGVRPSPRPRAWSVVVRERVGGGTQGALFADSMRPIEGPSRVLGHCCPSTTYYYKVVLLTSFLQLRLPKEACRHRGSACCLG